MSEDIRELVRYQIPGYILIVYSLLLLFPFVNLSWFQQTNSDSLEILGLIISFAVTGIPLGWLLFQIYDSFFREFFAIRYAWKKPMQILEELDKEKKTDDLFRKHLMDYALLRSDLTKNAKMAWAHASSRTVVGLLVPLFSPILAVILYCLVLNFAPQVFLPIVGCNLTSCVVRAASIWLVVYVVLFLGVYLGSYRIYREIQIFIAYSLIKCNEDIKKMIEHKYADKSWTPTKE